MENQLENENLLDRPSRPPFNSYIEELQIEKLGACKFFGELPVLPIKVALKEKYHAYCCDYNNQFLVDAENQIWLTNHDSIFDKINIEDFLLSIYFSTNRDMVLTALGFDPLMRDWRIIAISNGWDPPNTTR